MNIDSVVLRELKRRGRRERKSLGELMSELLADAIRRRGEDDRPGAGELQWTARPMTARVDLEDKEALHRAIDQR